MILLVLMTKLSFFLLLYLLTDAGCPHLSGIDNGWVDIDPPSTIGSTATYRCKIGYFIAGVAKRICGPNGEWLGVPPSCEKGKLLC